MKRITLSTILLLGLLTRVASMPIGEARGLPDTTPVSVTGCVTYLQPSDCYIESTDRASGIWVQPSDITGISIGDQVTVSGTIATSNGERTINSASFSGRIAGSAINPFAMRNSWLGGFYQAGGASVQDYVTYKIPGDGTGQRWQRALGAPTTGVLVKTWGTVKATYYSPITQASWFYIDDSSVAASDCGDQGIIVYSDADIHQGDFVTVTGISSTEVSLDDATKLVRSIRPRSSADVATIRKFQPTYPFSDEFDSPVLDSKWVIVDPKVGIDLTPNSGWLTLPTSTIDGHSPAIAQRIATNMTSEGENWDMEFKVRPQFDSSSAPIRWLYIGVSPDAKAPADVWLVFLRKDTDHPTRTAIRFGSMEQPSIYVEGDTFWFRYRQRGPQLSASVSSDGITYSDEMTWIITQHPLFFRAWAVANPGYGSYMPQIDYVRFTRVNP